MLMSEGHTWKLTIDIWSPRHVLVEAPKHTIRNMSWKVSILPVLARSLLT